ncbi:Vesicle-mediated ER to Golgi transport protein [Sparganum proliferum]
MDDEANDVDPKDLVNIPPDLGKQFTEIFIKEPENVQLVLSFLSSYDMHLRRQTIRLLTLLLENNLRCLQDILLNSPMAVSKFVDTICDPMEVIRNDGLLLLLTFTRSRSTIQKIVAFENVFQKVLNIVETETITDGGVVIEDCFSLIVQLLTGNKQNQMLFKDGRFIQRLANLFQSVPDELSESCTWSAQKLVNVGCLLKVFRTLVAPTNKTQNIIACQADMQSSGLLDSLWKVVMANGVPAELLMQTLYTMGDVVRCCPTNQQSLANLVAPSTPPQPAITVLLVTIVNERQQLAVRMAVLYCFQCLLASNAEIQDQVVSTLLPRAAEPCATSPGQLLCGGLFSHDALTAWFASIALLHSVHKNQKLKENLLQVHMAPTGRGQPVTLIQQCFRLLCQPGRVQMKIGLLQFLCVWLAHCPPAVHAFLSLKSGEETGKGVILSYLISEASSGDGDEVDVVSSLSALLIGICVCYNAGAVEGFDSKTLVKIIDERMGIDDLTKRINQISRSEAFILALQGPQLKASRPSDLVFDYEFTQIFKVIEFEVISRFSRTDEPAPQTAASTDVQNPAALSSSADTLAAYQNAIADRDRALQNFQLRVIELERQLKAAYAQDQRPLQAENGDPPNTVLKAALDEKTAKLQTAEKRIQELEALVKTLKTEKDNLQSEHTDLLLLLSDQDSQIAELTQKLEQQSLSVTTPASAESASSETPQPVSAVAMSAGATAQQNLSGSEQRPFTATEPQNAANPVSPVVEPVAYNPKSTVTTTTASTTADVSTYSAPPYLNQALGEPGHVFHPGYSTASANDYTGAYPLQQQHNTPGLSAANAPAPVYPQTQWQYNPVAATTYDAGAVTYGYSSAVYAQTTMATSEPANCQPGGYTAVSFGQS